MADVVSPEVRSRMMSWIRAKDTKPELMMRSALHRLGFRYRLHLCDLPGRPDLAFPMHRAVLFVHGCFWHGHSCSYFKMPSTRQDFWEAKIDRNRAVDARNMEALTAEGWRVGVVWECATRGKLADIDVVAARLAEWLTGKAATIEIRQ